MKPEEAISRLKGIRCGFKPTSCPDQLAHALEEMITLVISPEQEGFYYKKIVLTGGGTAGHVTPNIALLPALQAAGYEMPMWDLMKALRKS